MRPPVSGCYQSKYNSLHGLDLDLLTNRSLGFADRGSRYRAGIGEWRSRKSMTATSYNKWIIVDRESPPPESPSVSFRCDLTDPQVLSPCVGSGEANRGMSRCPDPHEAKRLFNQLRIDGRLSLILTTHAEVELRKDEMDTQDCLNVLRGGSWDSPEWENGAWRYRARTQRMTVIVEVDFECEEFCVVTAWRNK
jgi:hypothetical protein